MEGNKICPLRRMDQYLKHLSVSSLTTLDSINRPLKLAYLRDFYQQFIRAFRGK
jgi:hypothetical protein